MFYVYHGSIVPVDEAEIKIDETGKKYFCCLFSDSYEENFEKKYSVFETKEDAAKWIISKCEEEIKCVQNIIDSLKNEYFLTN